VNFLYVIEIIILAAVVTTLRVFGVILLSITSGWLLSYAAIKSKIFENIYIPLNEIFESVPVISFFPIVLILFVNAIGGILGVELAADFLVFTAVVWNIWMGEYQAYKTVPNEMIEVGENYNFTLAEKLKYIYIPFSIPRIAANLFPSFADAFFYITVSEVFSIGVHQYETFGIGSIIVYFYSRNQITYVYYSLLVMAIIISISIYLLREFSKYAVAKYTIDTDAPILRRGRINLRQTTRVISSITVTPLSRLARYYRFRNYIPEEEVFEKEEKKYEWIKYIPGVIAILIFIVLIYYSVKLIVSIPLATWNYLFSITPFIILNMLFDYIRIAIIAIVSLIFAILLGYYLAMHKRGEAILVPIIQTFSAFPPPIYFPIVFGISYPFVLHYFGFLATEIYVLTIGFVSTFYYVLYSFWMGFKAFPGEYFDVMENFQMNFFQKLRYIILPGTFPYLISGMTSTINSAWGGLMIGEYWPDIIGDKSLEVKVGLMKYISQATLQGNIEIAAWSSFIFSIVVVLYSLFFTKKLMDLARKKYVAEEGIYAA